MSIYDIAVIGGGIVGAATAMRIGERYPGTSIALLEREDGLAQHQTGRNSGVIHAGVYYQPGTMKALFCKAGVQATIQFCEENAIPYEQCGKLIVASAAEDLPRLAALHERSKENGLSLELLDAAELKRREPRIAGLGALFSPNTGIVDFSLVARTMASKAARGGGGIFTGNNVIAIAEDSDCVTIETESRTFRARHVVVCAGVMADRLARLCGLDLDFQIVPFRGEYYRLGNDKGDIVKHLIYPVPDPSLPFLGVHLTRMIGGYVTVGPNAVLAFARDGYRFADVSARDLIETLGYPGFRRLARRYFRAGLNEMANSLSKMRYLGQCQKYCPELTLDDLHGYRAGIRAQAVMADGTIQHDFLIRGTRRTTHICNAPSPAATSAIPIADHVVGRLIDRGVLV